MKIGIWFWQRRHLFLTSPNVLKADEKTQKTSKIRQKNVFFYSNVDVVYDWPLVSCFYAVFYYTIKVRSASLVRSRSHSNVGSDHLKEIVMLYVKVIANKSCTSQYFVSSLVWGLESFLNTIQAYLTLLRVKRNLHCIFNMASKLLLSREIFKAKVKNFK